MIGYGVFRPRRNAHTHLYGPGRPIGSLVLQAPLCGGVKWSNVVNPAWEQLYHDHPTPTAAAQAREVTCPRCLKQT